MDCDGLVFFPFQSRCLVTRKIKTHFVCKFATVYEILVRPVIGLSTSANFLLCSISTHTEVNLEFSLDTIMISGWQNNIGVQVSFVYVTKTQRECHSK